MSAIPYLRSVWWSQNAETDPIFTGSPAAGITLTDITNWNTAFGWGDHSGLYIPVGEKGAANGVATLGPTGLVPNTQIPPLAITDTFVVASEAAMLALSTAETGDVAVRTDTNNTYILKGTDPSVLGDWQLLNPVLPAEGDPIFLASDVAGVTTADITNWDTAYGWGDHSLAGYLTSYTETDPVFGASAASGIVAGDITNWDNAHGWGDHALAGYLTDAPSDGSEYVRLNGAWAVASGGGSALAVQDEGSTLDAAVVQINFVGAGVTATTPGAGQIDVTIPGGGGVTNPMTAPLDVNDNCIVGKDNATGAGGIVCLEGGDSQDLSGPGGYISIRSGAGDGSVPSFPAPPANAIPADFWLLDVQSTPGYVGFAAPADVSAGSTGNGSNTVWTLPEGDGSSGEAMITDGNGVLSWGSVSASESDPIFSASAAAGISAGDISNWNTAYGWGDHSLAGYLTSVPAGYVQTPMVEDLDVATYDIRGSDAASGNGGNTNITGGDAITNGDGGNLGLHGGDSRDDSGPGGYVCISGGDGDGTAPTLPTPPASPTAQELWFLDIQNPAGYVGFVGPDNVSAGATGDGNDTVWTLPEGDGTAGQVMVTNGAGVLSWAPAPAASASFSTLTPAIGANTVANGAFQQTWNWLLTADGVHGLSLGESADATGGAGDQDILHVDTFSEASTADPIGIYQGGNQVFKVFGANGDTSLGAGIVSDIPGDLALFTRPATAGNEDGGDYSLVLGDGFGQGRGGDGLLVAGSAPASIDLDAGSAGDGGDWGFATGDGGDNASDVNGTPGEGGHFTFHTGDGGSLTDVANAQDAADAGRFEIQLGAGGTVVGAGNAGIDGYVLLDPQAGSTSGARIQFNDAAGAGGMSLKAPDSVANPGRQFELAPKKTNVTTVGPIAVNPEDDVLFVDPATAGGPVVINLHSAAFERFRHLVIKVISNAAFTVTINAPGGQTVEFAASLVIPAASQGVSYTLTPDGPLAWYII